MSLRTLRPALLLATVLLAPLAAAQPVRFFAQDTPANASGAIPPGNVPPGSRSATARAAFLATLNTSTVRTESFETFASQSTLPTAGAPAQTYALSFTGSAGPVPASAVATTGAIVGTPQNGIYPTSGTKYLFARGNVTFTFSGTPVSALGFYINDIETVGQVLITLTPAGGGTPVVLSYGPIVNSRASSQYPGEGQLTFVGFADKRTAYERVVVSFPGQSDEGFGFDEMTVGDVLQVTATQVTATREDIADVPGWRLLSAPVQGITVDALALQNLVQGIPAGAGVAQQQYPTAPPNLMTAYSGGGRYDYVRAPATGTVLLPGQGFWWYWYNRAINPADASGGGGTSESVLLSGFELSALGSAITSDVVRVFADNTNGASGSSTNPNPAGPGGAAQPADDDFYMIGNPFAEPFAVGAITATGGLLQDAFFAWNPGNAAGTPPADPNGTLDGPGSYEVLFGTTPGTGTPTYAAVWQGFTAEVSGPTAANITFTFAAAGRSPAQDPPFYGRGGAAEVYVHFLLDGTTASGAAVRDGAAWVRLRDDASLGWDRYDSSKPSSPAASYALLAPVGERNGAPYRQAIRSLPQSVGAFAMPLAFTANEAGQFTLRWEGMDSFPPGWSARLVDMEVDVEVDLAADTAYAFAGEPTGWTERFELRLVTAAPVAGEAGTADTFVGVPSPNPATSTARIDLRLTEATDVTVAVYDVLGRRIATVVSELLVAGAHAVTIPTASFAPGVYVVRIEGATFSESRRVTVVR